MDREFQKLFDKLCYGRTPHSVWDDFIYMAASAIANSVCFSQEREDRYSDIANKYKAEELDGFGELLARTVLALQENPHQDYLGQMFMELNFGNVRAGQYFTPYTIAEMMSEMTMGERKPRPYETVNDPACGSGVMLIAAYNQMVRLKRNPSTELFVVGQDVDFYIALMCYIQISLLGMAGYVVIGSSLASPPTGDPLFAPEGAWCTPLYYHWIWSWRRALRSLRNLEKENGHGTESGDV